ncbi:hypothetical protein FisN_5Lh400 [Fistulifera solaris]|uniref:WW domain-containing protein n=1 Tax=Fistulifera solaris TaxID=1519565 RepID=A0A1Z5KGY9_FISSO|nr:hypothetical protein FisN_5Lh400 [Fistulifera solaris]|eukprot:GAX25311.1 hypothetical protein FisN_5Lh400 [Fistulifera solaris]
MRSLHWLCIVQACGIASAAFQNHSGRSARAWKHLSYSASTEVDFLKRIQRLTRERDGKEASPVIEKRKAPKKKTAKAAATPSVLTTDSWLSNFMEGTSIQIKPFEDIWDKFSFQPGALASEGDWSAYWDEFGSGYIYFFNEVTGESQWDPPTLSFPKIDLKDGMKVTEKNNLVEDENDFSLPLASQGEWSAYFDGEKSKMVYYHNSLTGVSQWEKPTRDFPYFVLTPAMKKHMRRNKTEFVAADALAEISKIAGTWLRHFETTMNVANIFNEVPIVTNHVEIPSQKQPTIFTVVADAFLRSPLFGNRKAENKSEPSLNFLEQCMSFFGMKL